MVCLIMRGKPVQRRDAIGLPECATRMRYMRGGIPSPSVPTRKKNCRMIGLLERIAAENISTLRLG